MNTKRLARVLANIEKTPDGCWGWKGHLDGCGYGSIRIDGRSVGVHRFFYDHFKGPIEPGRHIDHLCKNRACVNPVHLEQVTPSENAHRAMKWKANLTHCEHGHEFTPENKASGRDRRDCKECHKRISLDHYHRLAEEEKAIRLAVRNKRREGLARSIRDWSDARLAELKAQVDAGKVTMPVSVGLGGRQTLKTHCPLGHPLAGENLRIRKNGWRTCRECDNTRSRELQRRKAAARRDHVATG